MYKPSQFISLNHESDGSLIVHSARTGALGVLRPELAEEGRDALRKGASFSEDQVAQSEALSSLRDGGLLVLDTLDEVAYSNEIYNRRYTDRNLHLICMPTEQCNFRCVYCYETFARGEMSEDLSDSLCKFIEKSDPRHIVFSWFGGEPLLAKKTVLKVQRWLSEFCASKDVSLQAGATTNGSLLVPELVDEIIPIGLQRFQITLDGLEHEHDKRRVGAFGEKTFDTIMANLRYMRDSDHHFLVSLRHNFDGETFSLLDQYLDMIEEEFGGDPRFVTEFAAIGDWGGENDGTMNLCDGRNAQTAWQVARREASARGFKDATTRAMLQPNGSVCYAANPHSFVIGSDGRLYKCTVELDYHDRNIVGRLNLDGTMTLDWDKMALWTETNGTTGQATGSKCHSCYFQPSCHGAVCPKEWMDEPECGCPPLKHNVRENLSLIRAESLFSRVREPRTPQGVAHNVGRG